MAATSKSKTRKAKPNPQRVAENLVDAEATGAKALMPWRGDVFVIDLEQIRFGRAAFAMRQADNEALPLMTRVAAMVDLVEAALGAEQTGRLVDSTPNLFDDADTYREFWQTFIAAFTGATPGESSAS